MAATITWNTAGVKPIIYGSSKSLSDSTSGMGVNINMPVSQAGLGYKKAVALQIIDRMTIYHGSEILYEIN